MDKKIEEIKKRLETIEYLRSLGYDMGITNDFVYDTANMVLKELRAAINKAGVIIEAASSLTDITERDSQVAEWRRCKEDPVYFINTYYTFNSPICSRTHLTLKEWQKTFVRKISDIDEHPITYFSDNIFRQEGKTTVLCAFLLWFVLFHSNKKIMLFSCTGASAELMMKNILVAYDNLPQYIKGTTTSNSNERFSLFNNSEILLGRNSDSLRGISLDLIIYDEYRFRKGIDEIKRVAFPANSENCSHIGLSSHP